MKTAMELTSDIVSYEEGNMEAEHIAEMFKDMMNNGMIVSMQGHYQRTANDLIEAGILRQDPHTKRWAAYLDELYPELM